MGPGRPRRRAPRSGSARRTRPAFRGEEMPQGYEGRKAGKQGGDGKGSSWKCEESASQQAYKRDGGEE